MVLIVWKAVLTLLSHRMHELYLSLEILKTRYVNENQFWSLYLFFSL